MEKQIEIKIKPDGSLSVDLIGFNGEGCSKVAKQFIEALGRNINTNTKTEYYSDNVKNENIQKNKSGY